MSPTENRATRASSVSSISSIFSVFKGWTGSSSGSDDGRSSVASSATHSRNSSVQESEASEDMPLTRTSSRESWGKVATLICGKGVTKRAAKKDAAAEVVETPKNNAEEDLPKADAVTENNDTPKNIQGGKVRFTTPKAPTTPPAVQNLNASETFVVNRPGGTALKELSTWPRKSILKTITPQDYCTIPRRSSCGNLNQADFEIVFGGKIEASSESGSSSGSPSAHSEIIAEEEMELPLMMASPSVVSKNKAIARRKANAEAKQKARMVSAGFFSPKMMERKSESKLDWTPSREAKEAWDEMIMPQIDVDDLSTDSNMSSPFLSFTGASPTTPKYESLKAIARVKSLDAMELLATTLRSPVASLNLESPIANSNESSPFLSLTGGSPVAHLNLESPIANSNESSPFLSLAGDSPVSQWSLKDPLTKADESLELLALTGEPSISQWLRNNPVKKFDNVPSTTITIKPILRKYQQNENTPLTSPKKSVSWKLENTPPTNDENINPNLVKSDQKALLQRLEQLEEVVAGLRLKENEHENPERDQKALLQRLEQLDEVVTGLQLKQNEHENPEQKQNKLLRDTEEKGELYSKMTLEKLDEVKDLIKGLQLKQNEHENPEQKLNKLFRDTEGKGELYSSKQTIEKFDEVKDLMSGLQLKANEHENPEQKLNKLFRDTEGKGELYSSKQTIEKLDEVKDLMCGLWKRCHNLHISYKTDAEKRNEKPEPLSFDHTYYCMQPRISLGLVTLAENQSKTSSDYYMLEALEKMTRDAGLVINQNVCFAKKLNAQADEIKALKEEMMIQKACLTKKLNSKAPEMKALKEEIDIQKACIARLKEREGMWGTVGGVVKDVRSVPQVGMMAILFMVLLFLFTVSQS